VIVLFLSMTNLPTGTMAISFLPLPYSLLNEVALIAQRVKEFLLDVSASLPPNTALA
jgi:hypothetical protein